MYGMKYSQSATNARTEEQKMGNNKVNVCKISQLLLDKEDRFEKDQFAM